MHGVTGERPDACGDQLGDRHHVLDRAAVDRDVGGVPVLMARGAGSGVACAAPACGALACARGAANANPSTAAAATAGAGAGGAMNDCSAAMRAIAVSMLTARDSAARSDC